MNNKSARSKKNQQPDHFAIAMFSIFTLLLLALTIPALLILGKVINLSDKKKFTKIKNTLSKSNQQNSSNDKRSRNIKVYQQLILKINTEGEHLARRKDGFFSERTQLGRELNIRLEKITHQLQQEENSRDQNPIDIDEIYSFEHARLTKIGQIYNFSIALYLGCLWLLLNTTSPIYALSFSGLIAGAVVLIYYWVEVPYRPEEESPDRDSDIYH